MAAMIFELKTQQKQQVLDITSRIETDLAGGGLVNIMAMHTTVAVVLADLDPGTDQDYLVALESLTPDQHWTHPHDPKHFPEHFWSSVLGQTLTLPFEDGKLVLGTWQRVALVELSGPRVRRIVVSPIVA